MTADPTPARSDDGGEVEALAGVHPGGECVSVAEVRELLARHVAKARAEALMDAREEWVGGEGTRVMFNRDGLDLTPQGRVAYWLRTRADEIRARADSQDAR